MKKFIAFGATLMLLFACNDKVEETNDEVTDEKDPKVETKVETVKEVIKSAGDLKIAFFYLDSIMESFDYFKKAQKTAQDKVNSIESRLYNKQAALEKEAMEMQSQAQQGLMTSTDIKNAEADLQRKSENFQRDKMNAQNELSTIQIEMEKDVMVRIRRQVKKYAEENGYDMIQQRSTMESGYFANSFNLTSPLIEIINREESK